MRGHPVTLEAGETEIRRLSAGDFERLMDIAGDILENAANRALLTGVPFDPKSPASLTVTLIAGLRGVRAQLREFAASLLPDTQEVTLTDLGAIIEAMATHPDIVRFLAFMRRTRQSPLVAQIEAQLNGTPAETGPESST